MNTTRLRPLLLGALAALSACASIERFQNLMDSHIGKSVAEVQQEFGYNYIERQLEDDKKAYTWQWTRTGVTPGYETPTTVYSTRSRQTEDIVIAPGTYFPPTYYEESCEFTFIANQADTVIEWQARGNGCASYPGPGQVLSSTRPPA